VLKAVETERNSFLGEIREGFTVELTFELVLGM
jgi:hypothetical protein